VADAAGLRGAKASRVVSFHEVGGLERLAVPIWHSDEQVGILWLITDGLPKLQRQDYGAIDASVLLAARLIVARQEGAARSELQSAADELLSPSAWLRREALDFFVRTRNVQRDASHAVRAVVVGEGITALQTEMLARAVSSRGRLSQIPMRASANALYFVGHSHGEADDAIYARASELNMVVLGIGVAPLDASTKDLLPLAEHSFATALVAWRNPQYAGRATTTEAASWLLVAEASTRPERLPWFSPAAQALLAESEPLRRETVEVYLDHAGRVRDACEALRIHRTSLYYRLETMPQVVRDALDDGLARSAMHLALKLARLGDAARLTAVPASSTGTE
jgi:hypothetical protein